MADLEFSRWRTIFGDNRMATVVISRAVHRGRPPQFRSKYNWMRRSLMGERRGYPKRRLMSLGGWHRLTGNRDGQWSGRLTGNYRIIVEPVPGGMRVVAVEQAVKVLSIEDYH